VSSVPNKYPCQITAIQVPPERWVKGDYRWIGNLRYSADEMARRLNARFMEDIEDGLGPFRAAGFQAPNGRRFHLTQYLLAPGGPALIIECLHDEHFSTDLDDVLESLDMDLSDIAIYGSGLAISPEAWLIRHALWRQDDNGFQTLVEVFPCRASASKRMRAFEATGHKQTYWIEPTL
jgi:hypothetical protein